MKITDIQDIYVSLKPLDYGATRFTRIEIIINANGERFLAQETHEPDDLTSRFDLYWESLGRKIKEQLKVDLT